MRGTQARVAANTTRIVQRHASCHNAPLLITVLAIRMSLRLHRGKILYAALFCLLLPALLALWATHVHAVHLPVPDAPLAGLALAGAGLALMLCAMADLWRLGKGLPMNAYPPKHYVRSGAYRLCRHPIYLGAVALCAGVALYRQSAVGLWLVTPVFVLLIIAYVLGLEQELTERRFPEARMHQPWLALPQASALPLGRRGQVAVMLMVFLPWLVLYEAFVFLGIPADAFATRTAWDACIPLWPASVIFYMLHYPFVALSPFALRSQQEARAFVLQASVGMAMIFYCYLVIPAIATQPLLAGDDMFSRLVRWNRAWDSAAAACPSFHVFWALLARRYWRQRYPGFWWNLVTALMIISCLTTGSHTLADVVSAIVVYYLAIHHLFIYRALLRSGEAIANSWREWRFGHMRLINHGFYAAAGGFCGFVIMGALLPEQRWLAWMLGISAFVGAGLWAQWVEGSSQLLRPFGYYGSVLGMALAALCGGLFVLGGSATLFGIAALAACPIQFFGRGRCLVQGCCHGKPTALPGIRFVHPKSRVSTLTRWQGDNLHPTQCLSMFANVLMFFLLWRLLHLHTPAPFIAGLYLILSGVFRFVEEALRGEPQTPYWLGMRVYQWLALASILAGMLLTTLPGLALPAPAYDISLLIQAFLFAAVVLFVYGVDFPHSQLRFSRLTHTE